MYVPAQIHGQFYFEYIVVVGPNSVPSSFERCFLHLLVQEQLFLLPSARGWRRAMVGVSVVDGPRLASCKIAYSRTTLALVVVIVVVVAVLLSVFVFNQTFVGYSMVFSPSYRSSDQSSNPPQYAFTLTNIYVRDRQAA